MSRARRPEVDALRAGAFLPATPLPAVPAPPALMERLRQSAAQTPRLGHHGADVAAALGISEAQAVDVLRHVDSPERWSGSPWPGVSLYHLEAHLPGVPLLQEAIVGLIRVAAGTTFPDHEHLGEEEVLILQGSCAFNDADGVARPGDRVVRHAGSHHDFTVRPGPDLVYLAVVRGGVRFGDVVMRPGALEL